MKKVLSAQFFCRPVLEVAPKLLGMNLITKQNGSEQVYMITEVEAYGGEKDKASHARFGKTERNGVMYEEGGFWYVYLVYGMYHMLNVTTDLNGSPSAILIRGVEGIDGPGKLTRELGIDKSFHEKLAMPKSGLWLEDRGVKVDEKDIKKTPRIGVDYAGKWAKKPYRFVLEK